MIVIPTVFVGRLRVGAVVGVGLFVASGAVDGVEVGVNVLGGGADDVEVGSAVAGFVSVGDVVGGMGDGLGGAAFRTTSVPPVGARVLPVYRSYGYEPAAG